MKNKVLLMTSRATPNTIQDSVAIPYGLYLLKNHLNLNGIECDVFDLDLKPEAEYLEKIKNGDYNIIGMGVTHCNMIPDLDLLYILKDIYKKKNKDCLFLAGGFSATLNYKTWLDCGFELICLGYAEDALLEICKNYSESNKGNFKEMLRKISGVAFKDRNDYVFNPSKPISKEDFEYRMFTLTKKMEVPYSDYWSYIRKGVSGMLNINKRSYVVENARLYTSSKCLANCGYCCCPAFLSSAQKSFVPCYMLSAKQVYELIVFHIKKYGAKSFSLNDEDFLIGSKAGIDRVLELCNLIIGSKKNGEIPEDTKFSCQTRASDFMIDENGERKVNVELVKKMAEAKFHNVSLGIESFSDRLIKMPSINKPYVKSEEYHMVLDAMMENNLYPTINLIFGVPEEEPEDTISSIEQTMKYVDKACQVSVTTKLLSFPGAPIWNSEKYPTYKDSWINPETNEKVEIPVYFIPQNEEIKKLIEHLEDDKRKELRKLREKYSLDKTQFLPRITMALCAFKVITESLGYKELNKKIELKLDELIKNAVKS